MKCEKITGYINYRNEEHIFILENYILNLIPSTLSDLKVDDTEIINKINLLFNIQSFIQ